MGSFISVLLISPFDDELSVCGCSSDHLWRLFWELVSLGDIITDFLFAFAVGAKKLALAALVFAIVGVLLDFGRAYYVLNSGCVKCCAPNDAQVRDVVSLAKVRRSTLSLLSVVIEDLPMAVLAATHLVITKGSMHWATIASIIFSVLSCLVKFANARRKLDRAEKDREFKMAGARVISVDI